MGLTAAGSVAVTRQNAALSASDWSQAAVGLELPPLAETFEVRGNVAQPHTQRVCVSASDIFSAALMISKKLCKHWIPFHCQLPKPI